MGLKSAENSEGAAFSKDVLRVEICGPNEEHLTIIDVPGKAKQHCFWSSQLT